MKQLVTCFFGKSCIYFFCLVGNWYTEICLKEVRLKIRAGWVGSWEKRHACMPNLKLPWPFVATTRTFVQQLLVYVCLLRGPNTCSYLASLKIHAVMHCDHDNCHHPKIIILAIVSLIFKCPLITMRPCLLGMLCNWLAHMFDATQLYLRTCLMLRNCTCEHVRCYAIALPPRLHAQERNV